MKYSRFDDVASLLIDLCEPFNNSELFSLMNIRLSMKKSKKFEKHYTAAVKGLYVKNFQSIKRETYQKQRFTDINNHLLDGIKNNTAELGLLPAYIKTDNTTANPAIAGLRAKIAKLHEN